MKINVKLPFHRFLSLVIGKYRTCVGVTSKTEIEGVHRLIADIDEMGYRPLMEAIHYIERYVNSDWTEECFIMPSPHGHHIITDIRGRWSWIVQQLMDCPHVDRVWLANSIKRGYCFLENYQPVPEYLIRRWCLKFMKIERVC